LIVINMVVELSAMPPVAKPTPDELLRQVQAEEAYARTGRLKVFLGYASGVGKTFRMLDEGRRRKERGQDVVLGAVQPRTTPDLKEALKQIPTIPLLEIDGVPVMHVEAILRRKPSVCLVDGLAYDNPPGSRNQHRWQDVEQLLAEGISVITTINLQFVEELREQVELIRGKSVKVSVPEAFLHRADEIVVVDTPTDFCVARTADSYATTERDEQARKLSQLREIALLLAADVVDEQLEGFLPTDGAASAWGTQERILVCLTPKANAQRMIERAKVICDRFHGELFVIYVGQSDLTADGQAALERNLALARKAGAEVKLLTGQDAVATIIEYAQQQRITQIFIGHSLKESIWGRFSRNTVDRVIRAAEGIDVKLFPH